MWIIPKTLSAFVPDMAESSLDLNELASILEQSAMWRSKPSLKRTWLQRLNKVKWMQHLSGRILRPLMASRFVEKYTASLAATPVSRSPRQGDAREQKTQDTFSRIYANTFVQLDLFGVSSRTSADTSIWDSMKFTKAFEIWATRLRQDYLVRQSAKHRTQDKDCSLWLTPRVLEVDEPYENYLKRMQASPDPKNNTKTNAGNLSMQVEVNWPTPDLMMDGNVNQNSNKKNVPKNFQEVINWSTPTVMDTANIQNPRKNHPGGGQKPPLAQMVNNWPTLTVAEAQKIGNNANYGQVALGNHPAIRGTVKRAKKDKGDGQPDPDKSNTTSKSRGQLNPAWVEQLMGLPAGWTNFDSWATELSHKQQS